MLNKAIEWNLLFSNPIGKLTLAKEEPKERILSEKEIPKLINLANDPLKSIILVALNTGMRLGEILNLEWAQVNLGSKTIFIPIKKAKSRKIRRIPLLHIHS
jgi:integrase